MENSHFAKLPRELRDQIWSEVVKEPTPIKFNGAESLAMPRCAGTCRQMREETTLLHFKINEFSTEIDDGYITPSLLRFRSAYNALPERVEAIGQLHIHILGGMFGLSRQPRPPSVNWGFRRNLSLLLAYFALINLSGQKLKFYVRGHAARAIDAYLLNDPTAPALWTDLIAWCRRVADAERALVVELEREANLIEAVVNHVRGEPEKSDD